MLNWQMQKNVLDKYKEKNYICKCQSQIMKFTCEQNYAHSDTKLSLPDKNSI